MAIAADDERTPRTTFQKSVAVLKPKPEQVSSRFLYYYLNANLAALIHPAAGAAQKNLLLGDIRRFRLNKPTLIDQERIIAAISPYDDLIDNNRRRIALLEEAARMLYREWFVYFRFPGHEHIKILDGIPDGWERVKVGQVLIGLESGGRPKGGAWDAHGIPSVGAENVIGVGQYDYAKEKFVPEEYFRKMRRGVVQNRDVLLYKDGAHIGRSSMFGDGFPHSQCAVNEHVFILRAEQCVGQSYLFFWLSQPESRQAVVNLNANTAQPGISQDKLNSLPFLLPPESLGKLFNESVEAQVAQIFRLALMNRKLARARDLLLPRLMNDEIAV
jgi:type I restriction enzyme S subunit